MVLVLHCLAQPDFYLIRITLCPEPTGFINGGSAVMLREDVIRIKGVYQNDRTIDVHIVLGRRYKKYVDIF